MDISYLRLKHSANDPVLFYHFDGIALTGDVSTIKQIWAEIPNSAWARASGHLIDDLIHRKMYDVVQLFWDHDMFRMAGRDVARKFIALENKVI